MITLMDIILLFYGKSWYYDVTTIYTPFHLEEKKHVIALEINLLTKIIRVMDCLIGLHTVEEIDKFGANGIISSYTNEED